MNGFGPEITAAIIIRDGNVCAMWGNNPACDRKAETANHRLNRGAGGSKIRNGMSNGCAICNRCNGDIESDALIAAVARRLGVKVTTSEKLPTEIPMWSTFFRQWVVLRDEALLLTGLVDSLLDARWMSSDALVLVEVGP